MSRVLNELPELVAHAEAVDSVLAALRVEPDMGLASDEARRRKRLGVNALRSIEPVSSWRILVEQFRTMIVWLLVFACALSYVFGELVEAAAILLVIIVNAAIGFVTELRGVRSMEVLRRLASRTTKVRRDGVLREIPAVDLAVGDIVVLEGGDVVTADLRLIECADLHADESALTGESVPIAKSTGALPKKQPVADRFNMVFKGTAITSGSGLGVVTAVGMRSELGRISSLVDRAKPEATPLERRLERLSRQLVWVTLALIATIGTVGVLGGREPLLMVEMAVALAVASFPEGLPMVSTVALARGMWRLAKQNVLIERLSAVETLGATTLVCTDKTGTLTENRMAVVEFELADGKVTVRPGGEPAFIREEHPIAPREHTALSEALRIGLLCGNAELADDDDPNASGVGDPMELALVRAAGRAGLFRGALLEDNEELREEAFSAETTMMATYHRGQGMVSVYVKGAPEAVLAHARFVLTRAGPRPLEAQERAEWEASNQAMAARGLRVLGLASKRVGGLGDAPYEDLVLVGLVGLLDPPRADVKEAIAGFHRAGIRVAMITGDHASTAHAVARALGLFGTKAPVVLEGRDLADRSELLSDATIFARVSPEQKLQLVELHQERGEIVAMTGDGVNDAPALKKSDIGIAMGLRGTQVAKEAADMVLEDDRFVSILEAVRQGRVIFTNIRRFVLYLLSCNLSEIMVVGVAAFAQLPLPLLPLQILFLNLVTDVFPALALGVGEGDEQVMQHPPRDPKEDLLTPRHWTIIVVYALVIASATLGAMLLGSEVLGLAPKEATTVSFLTLGFAQTWHVLNLRAPRAPLWRNDVLGNRYVWAATAACIVVTLLGVYVPISARVMQLQAPTLEAWGLILGMSLLPLWVARPLAAGVVRLAFGRKPRPSARFFSDD